MVIPQFRITTDYNPQTYQIPYPSTKYQTFIIENKLPCLSYFCPFLMHLLPISETKNEKIQSSDFTFPPFEGIL